MKALVIGGSGFLGSHVADALTENNFEVSVLDKIKSKYINKKQKMIIGDITDKKIIEKHVKNTDYVYNFAGIADIEISKKKTY